MSDVFEELELRIIREHERSGVANANVKGAKIYGPQTTLESVPSVFLRHYLAFQSGQVNLREFTRAYNFRTTVYKYVGQIK